MRKILVLICLFTFVISAYALPAQHRESSHIMPLESTNIKYDLGELARDTTTEKKIIIINKLNEDLEITAIRSTCDCVKADFNIKGVLYRGGMFEGSVIINTAGIAGEQVEVLYIISKNPNFELIRLEIHFKVAEKNK